MKRYPKIVQCDKRGQIVIPKDVRSDLKVDEGTGFWMYTIIGEGILLKKVDVPQLEDHTEMVNRLQDKAEKINISKDNVRRAVDEYKKTKDGNLDVI